MTDTDLNTRPLHTLGPAEATIRLTQVVKQAYFRRSRQLPANLSDIIETLKADILRVMPAVTINQIDEAVTDWVLNQVEKPLSPAFFFAAIRSRYEGPRRTRAMDQDQWTRPDTEQDFLNLIDTLASMVGHRPIFFNSWREYDNLVRREQLDPEAWRAFVGKASARIASEDAKDGRVRRIKLNPEDESVQAMARRLAVEDWLRSCAAVGKIPSQIIKNHN